LGKAFGMQVLVWGSCTDSRERARAGRVSIAASSRDEFFEQSDVLSLHLRLTEERARPGPAGRSLQHEADGLAGQYFTR
jgi:phosphoglycerate dehydrogenase-like enzyme